ncbi:Zinc finger C2H2 [Penicillium canariense]|uniref:Zinc finger C2H2 n=1 Tax=Penicillium canariense TaxID=189055 RepID=A0A9W9LU09_9EURO|nr:Zinc finger C2H2 [Penicillium canariense]KAJ5176045.1 Zinc finger C2H2 [Penicillium canariense]
MDNRPTSEYAQSGSHHPPPHPSHSPLGQHSEHSHPPADQTSAAAATAATTHYAHTPQPERPQYSHTPQLEVRPANISSSNTPQPEYGLNPPPARSPAYQDYLPRPQSYAPNSQPGGAPGMAQATSPFLPTPMPPAMTPRSPDAAPPSSSFPSDAAVPLDPSLPANSPPYPPPYSPYQPQGHDMAQYQGHPPPPHQMYARPDWPHSYGQQHHGLPGPYASPAATTVGSASPSASAGPRPASQVYSFVPIPGAQQHKRPRRRYEEIERMYKCGWNGCEKAYGTLNHLNAHVTMQSHGAKRTPEEFKEIRKEWKARKKEEESQRKAAEERERAAAQAGQVEAPGPSDPSQGGQPPSYAGGVRPQLPPIGYQPADGQVPGQYGAPGGGMVYQSNGQMGYPPNYPHSPYQSGPVYQQRE